MLLLQGTIILIPVFVSANSKDHYGPTADQFIPERWLQDDSSEEFVYDGSTAANGQSGRHGDNAARNSNSKFAKPPDSMAFMVGQRDCIGQTLARMELQVVLALLLGRFRFELGPEVGGSEGLQERMVYHITLQPDNGLPMKAIPRA